MIDADTASHDYESADLWQEVEPRQLIPRRPKRSQRAFAPSVTGGQSDHRPSVATAGSLIEQLVPKSMHAVTSQGFTLQVVLFVMASSLNGYLHL